MRILGKVFYVHRTCGAAKIIHVTLFVLILSACSSYENFKYITQDFEIPSKVFKSDFNQTWQAVLQVMRKYDIEKQNQEAGVIKTRWIDNTRELNFADSFGSADKIKAAKFKLVINVVKGHRFSREVAKVTIYKRQLIEQDFLQGWKEIRTDGTQEKVFLYRLDRIITMDNQLKAIEKAREREQIGNF
ncbi:MAG: outer membrane protein assembly factor BamC [Bacteriovoracaceae bacterium]|jgi:hypothetical protein|nr:outer membrane protein assembly factor BamC [Bacteriovoracaceae bacterium]